MYALKKFKQKNLIAHIFTVLLIIGVLVSISKVTTYFEEKANKMIKTANESAIADWLNSFVEGDYEKCDFYIQRDKDKIMTFDLQIYMADESYYIDMLNAISNSIKDINILRYKTIDNVTTYDVEVKYSKFKPISDLKLSGKTKKGFGAVKTNYTNGSINLKQAEESYKDLHYDIFDENCLVPSDEEGTIKLSLKEERDKNGNVYVTGVENLLDTLIEDTNAKDNILVYQERIYDLTNKQIKSDDKKSSTNSKKKSKSNKSSSENKNKTKGNN